MSGDPQAALQAFMEGKVKIQGDLTKLMAAQAVGRRPRRRRPRRRDRRHHGVGAASSGERRRRRDRGVVGRSNPAGSTGAAATIGTRGPGRPAQRP